MCCVPGLQWRAKSIPQVPQRSPFGPCSANTSLREEVCGIGDTRGRAVSRQRARAPGRVGGVTGHVGAAPPEPHPPLPPRHCCGSGASGSGVPIQTSNATLSGFFFRVVCPSGHLLPCARKTDPGTSRCRSAAVRPRDPRSPRGFCRRACFRSLLKRSASRGPGSKPAPPPRPLRALLQVKREPSH